MRMSYISMHTHTHIYIYTIYIRIFHPVKGDALWADLLISEQNINIHIAGNRICIWLKLLIKVLIRLKGEGSRGSASRLPGWGDCAAKIARFRPKRRHCGRRRR